MKIFGDRRSGNCLKVMYVAKHLNLTYEWIDVDIMQGESRTAEALTRNPTGQVPCIELETGEVISQSNAIMLFLAHDTELMPRDPLAIARVHQWLFWEQYSHEPNIAVCRFQCVYLGKSAADLDVEKVSKGNAALDMMEAHLATREWFVADAFSVADIGLWAYTYLAHEGGFNVMRRPALATWVSRVSSVLGVEHG